MLLEQKRRDQSLRDCIVYNVNGCYCHHDNTYFCYNGVSKIVLSLARVPPSSLIIRNVSSASVVGRSAHACSGRLAMASLSPPYIYATVKGFGKHRIEGSVSGLESQNYSRWIDFWVYVEPAKVRDAYNCLNPLLVEIARVRILCCSFESWTFPRFKLYIYEIKMFCVNNKILEFVLGQATYV